MKLLFLISYFKKNEIKSRFHLIRHNILNVVSMKFQSTINKKKVITSLKRTDEMKQSHRV
jgi:hypothetical protein